MVRIAAPAAPVVATAAPAHGKPPQFLVVTEVRPPEEPRRGRDERRLRRSNDDALASPLARGARLAPPLLLDGPEQCLEFVHGESPDAPLGGRGCPSRVLAAVRVRIDNLAEELLNDGVLLARGEHRWRCSVRALRVRASVTENLISVVARARRRHPDG